MKKIMIMRACAVIGWRFDVCNDIRLLNGTSKRYALKLLINLRTEEGNLTLPLY